MTYKQAVPKEGNETAKWFQKGRENNNCAWRPLRDEEGTTRRIADKSEKEPQGVPAWPGQTNSITSLDLRGYSIIPEASTHSDQKYVRSHKLYEGRPKKGWCGGRASRGFHSGGAGGRRRQACIEKTHVHWPASPSRHRHPPLDPGSTMVENL